ncbi:50S ribosomal protein L6 [Candidatus Thorarchaeota archaeon]|jgi:large subunit ribosomal protein L6|nr:50S ribosomal protein L6 [Candidatus Thorarchaeota archaeon]TFG95921.1 MAG: 50S ribosomal protein L6 [Candidatus Thorarchaeota archaeon]
MSKEPVYEKRIEIISECQVTLEDKTVIVTGPKGTLKRSFPELQTTIKIEGNEVIVGTHISRKRSRALVGTVIAHVRNMMLGVHLGYEYEMKIVFSHFPITVEVKDKIIWIKNFIGERGLRSAKLIGDIKIRTTEDEIFISGINLEHVAQSAANIQQACRIRDKDRRVFLDGIYVIRKTKGDEVKSIV